AATLGGGVTARRCTELALRSLASAWFFAYLWVWSSRCCSRCTSAVRARPHARCRCSAWLGASREVAGADRPSHPLPRAGQAPWGRRPPRFMVEHACWIEHAFYDESAKRCGRLRTAR